MNITRHHTEWLSLVEVSGPFLSMPVLMRAFPQGLPVVEPELKKETRLMFDAWEDSKQDRAIHHGWCDFVIRNVLQFPAEVIAEGQTIPPGIEARMSEYGEVLRPDIAIIPPVRPVNDETNLFTSTEFDSKKPNKNNDPTSAPKLRKPRLLIQFYQPDQDLEKPLHDKHWKASPATRMTELLHASDVPLGLITNGEHWMLVHAPRGETSGFASWYSPLWFEEPITFQAFAALLSVQRFFGVAENDTIEALLTQSAQDQQEVTEQLGWQVRKAVEVLIQSLDKIDQDYKRQLLEGVSEKQLYEAALTVMMRLVFLFSAEERGLLLLGDPLYDEHYAVSTLRDQLQEVADKHVEEILDSRFDAWSRLLATFRAVFAGVQHESMRLPPYGGNLFDPDRFPFLEGRGSGEWRAVSSELRSVNGELPLGPRSLSPRNESSAHQCSPLKISNRTVLHLLNALQILQAKATGSRGGSSQFEARRLSFRSLDIEQIGHVYEGLLDHTAKRATEPVLGLKGSKDKEPEIPLSKLEELAAGGRGGKWRTVSGESGREDSFMLAAETPNNVISLPTAKGSSSYGPPEKLVEFIKEETGRSVGAIKRELTDQSGVDESKLLIACGHDRDLLDRIWPFAALLRDDTFGFPVVIPTGSIYVTQGSDRRSTGTHYTPRSLTEPIVQHTLEPLVYIGPAEGLPKEQWKLKSAKEILELKVCDMAMGSGAFLVQTCRYMSERLVEAWEMEERRAVNGEQRAVSGEQETANSKQQAASGVQSDPLTTTHHSPLTNPIPLATHHSPISGSQPPLATPLSPLRNLIVLPDGSLSVGDASERLLPVDPAERLTIARRFVADRCLYGVDINPMAVEMAKLSLWLITLQRDRPFTFLDHALRCGDSLLGVNNLKQIENFSLREGDRQMTFATANLFRYVDEATEKRCALENLPSNDHSQIENKIRLHMEAEAATAKVKAIANCLIAFELRGLDGKEYENQRMQEAEKVQLLMQRDADAASSLSSVPSRFAAHHSPLTDPQSPPLASRFPLPDPHPLPAPDSSPPASRPPVPSSHFPLATHCSLLAGYTSDQLHGCRPFHWPIEFPEVFSRSGFDAFVGNPPFMGGQLITPCFGSEYRTYLIVVVAGGQRGSADFCSYFVLRSLLLMRASGQAGLISTNTIAEGETRIVGLGQFPALGGCVRRAIPTVPWPGAAALAVAILWFTKGSWKGQCFLDNMPVRAISSALSPADESRRTPQRLQTNRHFAFKGTSIQGVGFLLTPEQSAGLIATEANNSAVLFPYLGGDDVTSRPDCSPSRWCINFHNWPLSKAENYPQCLAIVREKVKPTRDAVATRNTIGLRRSQLWWQFDARAADLYDAVAGKEFAWVVAKTSKYVACAKSHTNVVFSDGVIVFNSCSYAFYSFIASTLHSAWVEEFSSTLETRLRYTVADAFDTFAFPFELDCIDSIAQPLVRIGELHFAQRSEIMLSRGEGMTQTYNRFHNPGDMSDDIARLRSLHVEMDQSVAAAYGWSDLDLGHGFHETKQGIRYTISESARRTVLDRLLALNHQRYEEEVKAGLHDKAKGKGKGKKREAGSEEREAEKRTKEREAKERGPGSEDRGAGNASSSSEPPQLKQGDLFGDQN